MGALFRVGQNRPRPKSQAARERARMHPRLPRPESSRKASHMSGMLTLAELDEAIAEVRANLRDLVEQETARSGADDENRGDDLIAAQEDKLARLLEQREALLG